MIKNFDLSTWTQFSNRKNSQSYVSADKKWMVKFPTEMSERDDGGMEKEKEFTIRALEVGIKTPKVGDVVELPDGRRGLIYEMIENKSSIARAIAKQTVAGKMISLVGGGETVAALDACSVRNDITYVSTGGGAFLEFIEGKEMPAIEVLKI